MPAECSGSATVGTIYTGTAATSRQMSEIKAAYTFPNHPFLWDTAPSTVKEASSHRRRQLFITKVVCIVIGIAKITFSKMKDVLKSTKIPLNARKRILQCYVWSTLLYGAETWTITKVMKTHIEAFELWAYRRMLKISWTEQVTNKEVLSRMKMQKRLFTIIQMRKYFGHIDRHSSMQTTLLSGRVNGKKGRGRPRTSWISNIREWTGKSYIEALRLTSNRYGRRIIALNPLQEDGTWWWWWWWCIESICISLLFKHCIKEHMPPAGEITVVEGTPVCFLGQSIKVLRDNNMKGEAE